MPVFVKQLVVVIAITGASLGLLAGTAGAEPSGGAEGISGDLLTPITTVSLPPLPVVNLPPGGSTSVAGVDVTPLLSAGVLNAASQQTSPNGSASSASVAGVSALPGVADLVADVVSSECAADGSSVAGSSAIANGSVAGTPLAVSPNPNSSVAVPLVGTITLNQQQTTATGISVRAIHLVVDTPLGVSADVPIATSVCSSVAGATSAGLPEAGPAPSTSANPSLAG
jgi:hypothetical protein